MYIPLLIFLKTGLFIINDNVKNKIKIYKEGYFGPYKVAIGEFYGDFKKESETKNYIKDNFYSRILGKISLNPSALKNAEKINISNIITTTDTPMMLPNKVILIYTEKEGLYSIPGYMLKSEGVNLDTINPEYITIMGKEGRIPVILKGMNDGRFDPQDEIIFYAKRLHGNNSYYNLYSFENVYILFFNRDYKVELPEENSKPQNDTIFTEKAYFKFHFEEEKLFPDLDPANSDTEDIWFWKYLEQDRKDTTVLKLPEADDSLNYTLRLNFDTDDVGTSIYTHRIYIKWGNTFIDSFYYESKFPKTIEVQIPGYILNSDSLLILEEKSEIGNYLNWIQIEGEFLLNAARNYNNLKFHLENIDGNIEIKGFKEKPEYFININKKNYVNFETFSYYENGKKFYGLRAKIEETQPSEYFVCTELKFPDSLKLYKIEKEIKKETGAEVLIIYHPKFKEYADSLALFHSSSAGGNYTVKTFSVKDIYVQFNNGIKSPFAIRKFLKYFWVNKNPEFNYVILIGDASKDPRNILGEPMKDYIPIFYYPSTFQQFESNAIFTGFYSSDFYYSNIIGDDPFPDVVVSRIPVQNINEMKIVFKKIKDYAIKKIGIWRRHFILATERKIEPGTGNPTIYKEINDFLKSLFKKGMTSVEPDENENPENFIRYLSDGGVIFNFLGHGGHHTLWGKGAFRQEDLWETTNYGKYYFFTALSCWTGEFGMWDSRCFGEEALLLPQRGAIATISLSGSGKEPGNVNFDISSDYTKSVFIGYLRDSITRIGDLVLYSRLYLLSRHSIEDQFTRTTLKTSNLLGDPLLELPYLKEVNLKTDKNYASPSDSIRAYVQISPIYSGTSVWEIIYRNLNDKVIARDLFTKIFDNGNLEIKFKVPDTVQRAKAEINLYAAGGNPLKEIIGSTYFSVSLLNIDTLYFKPDIYSEDTFRVFAKLSAKNPLKTCELWYSMTDSLNPGTMKRITMTKLQNGFFKTDTVLLPFYTNHKYFHYAFIASDTLFNTYYSDTFYIKNKTYADIVIKKGLINITPGNNMPEINFPYTNSGERDADSFYVFYKIETNSGRLLKSDTFFINSLKSQETKILKIPVPCTTYYKYKIEFDITNSVREISENNNADSGIIHNPYIYVDTSGFKGKLDFNSMTFETEFNPSKNLSIYYLKRRKNTEINDSTISIIPIKEEKIKDTIGKFYFANINQIKDIILKTEKDSLWHKIDYTYDSTNNRIEFFLTETGEIALYNVDDTKGPEIEVFYNNRKIEGNKVRSSRYLNLKLVLKDSSGIDLLFKKPEILINNENYNYSNSIIKKEKSAIINLKQGPFKEGIYNLKITAYDVMGNKTEKNFELEVYIPFDVIYYGNYPNPAKNGKTVIFYELTKPADKMEVKLFTISGRLIREFKTDDEGFSLNLKGKHKITWNLRDGYGNEVSNGVYFLLLKAERKGEIKKKIGKIAVGQ